MSLALTSLRFSIQNKWLPIFSNLLDGKPIDENGVEDCPCCQAFLRDGLCYETLSDKDKRWCMECPIYKKTGNILCENFKEYNDWNIHKSSITALNVLSALLSMENDLHEEELE